MCELETWQNITAEDTPPLVLSRTLQQSVKYKYFCNLNNLNYNVCLISTNMNLHQVCMV